MIPTMILILATVLACAFTHSSAGCRYLAKLFYARATALEAYQDAWKRAMKQEG